MDCHLVAVEVGIESGTSQWVQLNSFAFYQLWLESLNTQTVKRRGTVQKNGMTFHHILQDVPNNWFATVYNLLGTLYGLDDATLNEFTDDKRLIKFSSHQLRQTALAHLQLRADNNDRTCRIVNTLSEQVLTETSLLSFKRVGKRLQGTVAFTLNST